MLVRRLLLIPSVAGFVGGISLMAWGFFERSSSPPAPRAMLTIAAGTSSLDDAGVPVGAFRIDALEVSVAEYGACVRAGACRQYSSVQGTDLAQRHRFSADCHGGRRDDGDSPMNCVDWFGASAYCRWMGKRLPTREEWWLAIVAPGPEHEEALHRIADAVDAEWTDSRVKLGKAPEWDAMRWVGLRYDANHSSRPRMDVDRDSNRWPDIGFRCAQ